MSTDKGYIKLYRDVRDHWIWRDDPFDKSHAWIDLLMRASHETKQIMFNGKPITVEKGSFITSIKHLAEAWGWSRHKVSDFLDMLEREKMLVSIRDTKKTTINIVNYCTYQDSKERPRTSKGHQKDIRGTSEGHNQYTIEGTKEGTMEEGIHSGAPDDSVPWWEKEDDETAV